MSQNDPYHLHDSIGYQLSVSARIQERRLDEDLKTLGLTRSTWCVLLAVGVEGLTHPSEIAEFVGIDRTSTSRALRQMDAAGLIARSAGEEDRRMTTVALTEAGRDALAKGSPMARGNNQIMEDKLSAPERQMLRDLLQKVREGEDTPLGTL